MKNYFFSCLLSSAVIITTGTLSAHAQTTTPLAMTSAPATLLDREEKAISPSETNSVFLPLSEVSAKAIRSLKASYKNARATTWSTVKGAYLAEFEAGGRKSRALFSRNGYMVYGITYGSEHDLPVEERRLLKSNYVDYEITSVANVQADGKQYWICTLQDPNNIVITRTSDGVLEELQHMSKKLEPKGKRGKVIIPN